MNIAFINASRASKSFIVSQKESNNRSNQRHLRTCTAVHLYKRVGE